MKKTLTWTPYFSIHDIFEVYPNVDPKTRAILNEDGTQGTKLPDGGLRLRFLGPVPKWYAKREQVFAKEFGQLTSSNPNPIENLIQDKDNIFGGLYCYADAFYEPYNGSGYVGIATSGKQSNKNGNDPFGCGTLSRIWKHCLKVLGRHQGCSVQLTGGWKTHKALRDASHASPICGDSKFSFYIDYDCDQKQLAEIESAMQEHRLGKFGAKFPINELPASALHNFDRLPI